MRKYLIFAVLIFMGLAATSCDTVVRSAVYSKRSTKIEVTIHGNQLTKGPYGELYENTEYMISAISYDAFGYKTSENMISIEADKNYIDFLNGNNKTWVESGTGSKKFKTKPLKDGESEAVIELKAETSFEYHDRIYDEEMSDSASKKISVKIIKHP